MTSSSPSAPDLQHPPALRGSCRCGAITYTSNSFPTELVHCHCHTCRTLSGAPFCTFATFPASALTFSHPFSGAPSTTAPAAPPSALVTTRYSSYAERAHCGNCGSPLWMRYRFEPGNVSVPVGTVDEASFREGGEGGGLPEPWAHIFVAEKAGWYRIPEDGLQRLQGHTLEFQRMVEEWKEKERKGEVVDE